MNMPPRLRTNVLANAVGRFSSVILAILFTPVYIHLLGIEAYGLIGFYITLQASVSFLEMGLSRACNRQLARYSGKGESGLQPMLDTLRSLEVIYWIVAVLIGIALTLSAKWMASSWLNSDVISAEELESLLVVVAWVIALRWPVGLYSGAMMGLQRQVAMNAVQVSISILNWAGSALVLWLVSAEIEMFFEWQLVCAIFSVAVFAAFAWYAMPGKAVNGHFSPIVIRGILPFAAGVGGNAILGTILRQADKLILSAMLPLKLFGYYALASVIANAISMLAGPVSNAVFPRFSQLVGADASVSRIAALYHLACQAAAVLIIPFSLVIAFFSYELLFVYTGLEDLAQETATVLAVLVIAKMLHASLIVPYALQLAYGWVKLSLYINLISVLWLLPAVYWLTDLYGPVGAAFAWLIVTIGNVLVGMPLLHRKLLIGEWGRWIFLALLAPSTVVAGFLMLADNFVGALPIDRLLQGLFILSVGVIALILAAFAAADVRKWIWESISKRRQS